MPKKSDRPGTKPVKPGNEVSAEDICETGTGEHWRWCPRCGNELHNHKCKLMCPRCGYFMSCSDFD